MSNRQDYAMRAHLARMHKLSETNGQNGRSSPSSAGVTRRSSTPGPVLHHNTRPTSGGKGPSAAGAESTAASVAAKGSSVTVQAEAELKRLRSMIAASQAQRARLGGLTSSDQGSPGYAAGANTSSTSTSRESPQGRSPETAGASDTLARGGSINITVLSPAGSAGSAGGVRGGGGGGSGPSQARVPSPAQGTSTSSPPPPATVETISHRSAPDSASLASLQRAEAMQVRELLEIQRMLDGRTSGVPPQPQQYHPAPAPASVASSGPNLSVDGGSSTAEAAVYTQSQLHAAVDAAVAAAVGQARSEAHAALSSATAAATAIISVQVEEIARLQQQKEALEQRVRELEERAVGSLCGACRQQQQASRANEGGQETAAAVESGNGPQFTPPSSPVAAPAPVAPSVEGGARGPERSLPDAPDLPDLRSPTPVATNAELHAQVSALQAENSALHAHTAELEEHIEDLHTSVEQSNAAKAGLEQQLDVLQLQVEELQAQLAAQTEISDHQAAEIADMQGLIDDMRRDMLLGMERGPQLGAAGAAGGGGDSDHRIDQSEAGTAPALASTVMLDPDDGPSVVHGASTTMGPNPAPTKEEVDDDVDALQAQVAYLQAELQTTKASTSRALSEALSAAHVAYLERMRLETSDAAVQARSQALAEAETARVESVQHALQAAAGDFKAQLGMAISTLRDSMLQEKDEEVKRAVGAAVSAAVTAAVHNARAEYEQAMRSWEMQTEAWRQETLAACERSVEAARAQIMEVHSSATGAHLALRAREAEIERLKSLITSAGLGVPSMSTAPSSPSPLQAASPLSAPAAQAAEGSPVRQAHSSQSPSPAEGALPPMTPIAFQPPTPPPAPSMPTRSSPGVPAPRAASATGAFGAGSSPGTSATSPPHKVTPLTGPPAKPARVPQRLYETILNMTVGALQAMLNRAGVPYGDCVEKRELQERLLSAVDTGQNLATGGAASSPGHAVPAPPAGPPPTHAPRVQPVRAAAAVAPHPHPHPDQHGDKDEDGAEETDGSVDTAGEGEEEDKQGRWVQALTDEGRLYYYNTSSHRTRWTLPVKAQRVEGQVDGGRQAAGSGAMEDNTGMAQRAEDRTKRHEAKLRARQAERLAELAAAADAAAAASEGRSKLQADIDARVHAWSRGGTRPIRQLLTTLPSVLLARPGCLPEEVVVLASSFSSGPEELKRAYQKALRVIHPDKLASRMDVTPEALLEASRVFAVLSESYKRYVSGQERDAPLGGAGAGMAYAYHPNGPGPTFAYGAHHHHAAGGRGMPAAGVYHGPAGASKAGSGASQAAHFDAASVMAAAAARARAAVERMHAQHRTQAASNSASYARAYNAQRAARG